MRRKSASCADWLPLWKLSTLQSSLLVDVLIDELLVWKVFFSDHLVMGLYSLFLCICVHVRICTYLCDLKIFRYTNTHTRTHTLSLMYVLERQPGWSNIFYWTNYFVLVINWISTTTSLKSSLCVFNKYTSGKGSLCTIWRSNSLLLNTHSSSVPSSIYFLTKRYTNHW